MHQVHRHTSPFFYQSKNNLILRNADADETIVVEWFMCIHSRQKKPLRIFISLLYYDILSTQIKGYKKENFQSFF
jgi:hypothetical protein